MKIGIAGAGLIGRLFAWLSCQQGYDVTLFDKDDGHGEQSCGLVAAGMLTPYAEIETAESEILTLGLQSIQLWPNLIKQLNANIDFSQKGSLVLAHTKDWPDLQRFITLLTQKVPQVVQQKVMWRLTPEQMSELEPEIRATMQGYYFPTECHINTMQLFSVLKEQLQKYSVTWHTKTVVDSVESGKIISSRGEQQFDWVIDSRGLGAKKNIQGLRGVRGELLWLHAPEVRITRPIRLMHPRYRLYIVPRCDNIYVVGATEIESEDLSPMTVRSMLELLSATYSLHAGFSEAHIVKTAVNCRPAMPDNMPLLNCQPGVIQLNGLYRHGYLLAPILCQQALGYIQEHGKEHD